MKRSDLLIALIVLAAPLIGFGVGELYPAAVDQAAAAEHRSGQWPTVREKQLHEHPICEACGGNRHLVVHHVRPVHLWPELELDAGNLITLCEDCHFTFGHLRDWKSFNPNVREDAAAYRARRKARPTRREDLAPYQKQFPVFQNAL